MREVTAGCSSDLESATSLARRMVMQSAARGAPADVQSPSSREPLAQRSNTYVCRFARERARLPPRFGMGRDEDGVAQHLSGDEYGALCEEAKRDVDRRVQRLLDDAYLLLFLFLHF